MIKIQFTKLLTNNKVISILLLIYVLATSVMTAMDGGDFDVYLDAARKLSHHQNIYAPPFIKDLQYYYSTLFALLLIPFSNHFFITEVIWSLLSYYFLYRTLLLVKSYFDFSEFSEKQKRIWLLITIVLSIQFILYNVQMIQVTIFLLWAIFESINLISKGKNTLGGFLLGFAINVKILPILLLPYLFYRGYMKALSITIITILVLLFIPSLIIGYDYNSFLLSEWWRIINPANKEHLFETGIGTHSLVALLPVYLTETIGEMDFKRNILNLNHPMVEMITNIFRILFLTASFLYLKSAPFKREYDKLNSLWELSYFVLLIPLLMPHQQKYAFIFVMPMISYLVYYFVATFRYEKPRGYYIAYYTFLICMLFFSPIYGSDVIGKFLFQLTQHYRILTFSTILLIPISYYCSPQRLKSIIKKFEEPGNHLVRVGVEE